jgi:hypothetical protein
MAAGAVFCAWVGTQYHNNIRFGRQHQIRIKATKYQYTLPLVSLQA